MGSVIFSCTHIENLAQVYRVNYLYIIQHMDRGEGDTVASQSMLAISCIKAHGTQCSEENTGKYDRNDDTRLYCSTSCGSAARDKRCRYESTMLTLCIHTTSAPLTLAV